VSDVEDAKRAAAERAVDFVASGSTLGLGTGSTMRYAIEALGRRLASGLVHSIVGVPTSEQTMRLAQRSGIPLTTLDAHPRLDLTLDGADEIDAALDLIKGLGGALLREKIVASASRQLVIAADWTKVVPALGTNRPVPVEVIPFGASLVIERLGRWPGHVTLRRLESGEPFLSDEGNWILDYHAGPIEDPAALDVALLRIPGVVDHGLFLGMASCAIVAGPDGVRMLERVATG
jgi:ribose 5-phosphate isomerase A